jgi:hypothetical protein
MVVGFRTMLAAAPHTAVALHLVAPKISPSLSSVSISKPTSSDNPKQSRGLISRTKSTARALFHQCTANVFRRNKAVVITTDESSSNNPKPSGRISLTDLSLAPNSETCGVASLAVSRVDNSGSSDSLLPPSPQTTVLHDRPDTISTIAPSVASLDDKIARADKIQISQTVPQAIDSAIDLTSLPHPEIFPSTEKPILCSNALDSTVNMHQASNLKKKIKKDKSFFKSSAPYKEHVIDEQDYATSAASASALVSVPASVPTARQVEADYQQEGEDNEGNTQEVAAPSGWAQVRAIPNEKFCQLVWRTYDPLCKIKLAQVTVIGYCEGSFHRVTFVKVVRNSKAEHYVVRIPAHGTSKLWTVEDDYVMERQVDMMRYIRSHTKVPVAEIFDYDTTRDTSLGMPYIVDSRVEGFPAYRIWFHEGKNYTPEKALRNSDHPFGETEKKRINFLRSLACIMNELGTLQFDQSGSFIVPRDSFATPERKQALRFGPYYTWISPTEPGKPTKHLSSSFTQDLLKDPLDTFCNIADRRAQRGNEWHKDVNFCYKVGVRKIFDMVFSTPAFNQSTEKFTICHPGLDLQNIMTDKDGNVTGIIDWDGAFLAPRCMGASAVPKFLNRDWFPEKVGGLYSFPNLIWRSDEYRGIYAAAMVEESPMTEHPDARFISNSAIYISALSGILGLMGGGNPEDFVSKVIQSISRLHRIPKKEYLIELGRGLPDEETLLKRDITAMLEPRLLDVKYFAQLRSFKEDLLAPSSPALRLVDGLGSISGVSPKPTLPVKNTADNITDPEPNTELSGSAKEDG